MQKAFVTITKSSNKVCLCSYLLGSMCETERHFCFFYRRKKPQNFLRWVFCFSTRVHLFSLFHTIEKNTNKILNVFFTCCHVKMRNLFSVISRDFKNGSPAITSIKSSNEERCFLLLSRVQHFEECDYLSKWFKLKHFCTEKKKS